MPGSEPVTLKVQILRSLNVCLPVNFSSEGWSCPPSSNKYNQYGKQLQDAASAHLPPCPPPLYTETMGLTDGTAGQIKCSSIPLIPIFELKEASSKSYINPNWSTVAR
jgi:hypothetical protein